MERNKMENNFFFKNMSNYVLLKTILEDKSHYIEIC